MNAATHIKRLFSDLNVRWMTAAAVLIVFLSFYRAWIAGTVMVDEHGLTGAPMYFVLIGFLSALAAYSVAYYRFWRAGKFDAGSIRILSIGLTFLFSFMMPMLSNDIFSLLTYGDVANKGVNVYIDSAGLPLSPYFKYVNPLWASGTCIYGPVTLNFLRISAWIGNESILLSIASHKVVIFLLSVLFIETIYRISGELHESARPFLFIALNPVFLLQGVGQLHSDCIAMTFAGCMVLFLLDGKSWLAFFFAGVTIATKLNFLLTLPFLLVWLFIHRKSWAGFLRESAIGMLISLAVVAASYWHYYSNLKEFFSPMLTLFGQNPAKSAAEILGDLIYFIPSLIAGMSKDLSDSIHLSSGAPDSQLAAWLLAKRIFHVFAILIAMYSFYRFWSGKRDTRGWIREFMRLLLIFLLFYSHVFYVWYLMLFLPFMLYEEDDRFMLWLFVLTCFSNSHDIICAVSRSEPLFFVILPVLTFVRVALFFWRFRHNFFISPKAEERAQIGG